MDINQAILEYKNSFLTNLYSKYSYFDENNIDVDAYMERLSYRVRAIYDDYPRLFTDKRILDIGASTGDQSFLFNFMGNSVTALDINPAIISVLTKNVTEEVTVVDNYDAISEKEFDTVFCSGVINQQLSPYDWFKSLFGLNFKTFVLVYHDGYTIPNNRSLKMYSPDDLGETDVLVEKNQLIDACNSLEVNVIESDLTWNENVAIDGIKYTQTALIVEKP